MLAYAIRRFGQSVFVLLVMSFLVFIGVFAIGNPVELLVNPQADAVERARATHCQRQTRNPPRTTNATNSVWASTAASASRR